AGRARRSGRPRRRGTVPLTPTRPRMDAFEGQNVRPQAAGKLLGHGVITGGEYTGIEGALDRGDPIVVKILAGPRADAGPGVNRHGATSEAFGTESGRRHYIDGGRVHSAPPQHRGNARGPQRHTCAAGALALIRPSVSPRPVHDL